MGLVFLGLTLISNVVLAIQDINQLTSDTQSEATDDAYGFSQTLELGVEWEAATTTIELDVENLGESPDGINFRWFWNGGSNTYYVSDYAITIPALTRQKIILTTSSTRLQTMINDGWNTSTSSRGFQVDGVSADLRVWGDNDNSYTNGVFYKDATTHTTLDGNVADAYFDISFTSLVSFSVDFPISAATTTNFESWQVSYSNTGYLDDLADGYFGYKITIVYGADENDVNTCAYTDRPDLYCISAKKIGNPGYINLNASSTKFITNYDDLFPQRYYAKAFFVMAGYSSSTGYFYTTLKDLPIFYFDIISGEKNMNEREWRQAHPTWTITSPFATSTETPIFPFSFYMATSTCGSLSLFNMTGENIGCHMMNFVANFVNFFVDRFNDLIDGYLFLAKAMMNVFPLSAITEINYIFQWAKADISDHSIIIQSHGSIVFPTSYVILSSSTAGWLTENAGFDYRDLIDKFLYTITGGIVIFGSIGLIRKLQLSHSNYQ